MVNCYLKLRSGQIAIWLGVGLASAAGVAGLGFWQIAPCELLAVSTAQHSADIQVPYEEFRTMMVRNNATRAIVEHGGMQLKSEKVIDFDVDLSRDKRPLINALLRKSKSSVLVQKKLVVVIDDDELQADNLVLMQNASITPDSMTVTSVSQAPAGNLKSYESSLHAQPNGDRTTVIVEVKLKLCKSLSKIFHGEAKSRLQAAAQESVEQQCLAVQQFASEHSKH